MPSQVDREVRRRYWAGRITRPCSSCGRPRSCRWADTHWVCRAEDCGAEWDEDHDPIKYGAPECLNGEKEVPDALAG